MGKTILSRSLVGQIDRRTVTSLVLEPFQSLDELLKTMLVDFGVVSREDIDGAAHLTRDVLMSTLGSFLDSLTRLQAGALVLIDEAQNVPVPMLADVAAMLSGGPAGRMLQLVLVGQPELKSVLKHGDLRPLNASVARRSELGPLHADEISGYVRHRLAIAGGDSRIGFDAAAIARLFAVSEGSPRVVNLLCDRALTRGQTAAADAIDEGLIDAAAADLDLASPRRSAGVLDSLLIPAVLVLLFLTGAAAAMYVSRDALDRTIRQWENVPLPPTGPIRRLPVPISPIPPSGAES
jgi:general secretion pathway protein A